MENELTIYEGPRRSNARVETILNTAKGTTVEEVNNQTKIIQLRSDLSHAKWKHRGSIKAVRQMKRQLTSVEAKLKTVTDRNDEIQLEWYRVQKKLGQLRKDANSATIKMLQHMQHVVTQCDTEVQLNSIISDEGMKEVQQAASNVNDAEAQVHQYKRILQNAAHAYSETSAHLNFVEVIIFVAFLQVPERKINYSLYGEAQNTRKA